MIHMNLNLSIFDCYLICINVIGFILFAINTWLYSHTDEKQIDALLTITSLLGGSLGIVIAIFLIDRKAVKGNMMSRVFVFCVLVVQIILFLILKEHISNEMTVAVWEFFNAHKILLGYLLVINIVTIIAFAIDKRNAIERRSRIRIVTLLGLSFIGGSIGGMIAMYTLRHKTQKDYFTVGEPLILIMQCVVLFYIMNAKW